MQIYKLKYANHNPNISDMHIPRNSDIKMPDFRGCYLISDVVYLCIILLLITKQR